MKKVYICTPLSDEKFNLKLISLKILNNPDVFAFIPPQGQLCDKELGSRLDKKMIEMCDELWVFGEFGRDCSWEIGYAQGLGKRVIVIRDDSNRGILDEDWMTTINIELFDMF